MKKMLTLIILSSISTTIISCSGTHNIARASEQTRTAATAINTQAMGGGQLVEEVRQEAEATEGDLQTAKDTGDVGPRALPHVESALSHQTAILKYNTELGKVFLAIQDESGKVVSQQAIITQALPSVQDKDPAWLQGLKKLAWIVAPLALIVLLWQTGVGLLIKKFLWSLGLFLPRASNISAKFDAETLEEGAPTPSPREAVAARRALDPAYDFAYVQHQKKIRANPLPSAPGELSDGN